MWVFADINFVNALIPAFRGSKLEVIFCRLFASKASGAEVILFVRSIESPTRGLYGLFSTEVYFNVIGTFKVVPFTSITLRLPSVKLVDVGVPEITSIRIVAKSPPAKPLGMRTPKLRELLE